MIKYIKLFFLLICTGCGAQTTIDKNGFILEMPTEYETTIDSSYNHLTTYSYKSNLAKVTYQFNISEYHNNMYHSDSINNIEFDLDYSQRYSKGFKENTLFESRHKSIKGYPGKEYRMRNSYNKSIHFRRVYIIKNNVVELIYSGPETKLYDKEIMKFMNSLKMPTKEINIPLYLNIPTDEDLKYRPYESNLEFNSEQRVAIIDLKNEKNAAIITFEEFNPITNDGLKAIGVMYSTFSEPLTDQEKKNYYKNYIKEQSLRYNNFRLIEENDYNQWKSYKFNYQFEKDVIFEERRLNFENRRVYIISGIYLNTKRTPKKLASFFETFKEK